MCAARRVTVMWSWTGSATSTSSPQERMSRVLKNRKLDKRTAAFFRITGLEMKLNQYRMGEQFIKAVEKEAGWDTVNLAFRGVGSLPTLEEIEAPKRWLTSRRLTGLTDRLESLLDLRPGKPVIALSGGADSATLGFVICRGRP